jgi:hypothetical protein
MATTHSLSTPTEITGSAARLSGPLCLVGAIAAAGCFAVLGIGEAGGTGAEVTAKLSDNAGRYQLASILAIFTAVPLSVAAARLGRRIGGDAGHLATLAGVLVAMLMAAYFSAYAAGATVAEFVLDEAGPGVGESTLVLLNLVEFTRYTPGLLLIGAVLVARAKLPRGITIPAWVLLVLTLVPMTTWLAALIIPVWLGVAGALAPRR